MTSAETVTEQSQDYEAALARVAAYRDQLDRADHQADQNSLDRARDLELLYQAMRWIDEIPAPKKAMNAGRPVDPRSRSRFGTWVQEKTGLHPRYVSLLHKADETLGIIGTTVPVIPSGERALRSFGRLRRAGYDDRIPEVYKRAVQLAEGRAPTSAHTAQAVRDFLAQFTTGQRRAQSEIERARRHRLKAQTAVEILWRDNSPAEAEAFHEWYVALVRKMAEAEA